MHSFKVNKDKCIKCGLCTKVCMQGVINIQKNSYPEMPENKQEVCIGCQQCFAICPAGAVIIDDVNPENSMPLKDNFPEYSKLETLVKGRRSIRKFKDENIDKAELEKLLEDALQAPTGVNARQVTFTVIDDKEILNRYKKEIYSKIKDISEKHNLPEGLEFFEGVADKYFEKGIDIIFRNAPHVVIATASKYCPTPEVDSIIALSYLDLLAPAKGYGTLWCGMVKWAIHDILPEYLKILGIPEDHKMGYAMLIGKPAVKYKRTTQKPVTISYVK